jgi:hypothetical protein
MPTTLISPAVMLTTKSLVPFSPYNRGRAEIPFCAVSEVAEIIAPGSPPTVRRLWKPADEGKPRIGSPAVTDEAGMRAMRVQIAASILGIFSAGGLIFEAVEASARGGAFAGGRAVPGFGAAMIRPQPIVAPVRARVAPFAHMRHRRAPGAMSVAEPRYDDYNDSTVVPPDEQNLADTNPSPDANVIPRRLGCTKQIYRVRSEEGGTRTVAVVRC